MVLGLDYTDARLPDELVVDARHGWLIILFQRRNGEARFEEQNRDRFHQFDRVDLIIEECLFMPHRSHKELFLFENERHNSRDKVARALKHSIFGCCVLQCGNVYC